MNKVLNINLGGYALTIDDDAFAFLSEYLDNIRERFGESEGRDEILHDIEMRLGELITQDLGSRTIVMLPDVEAAVRIMGKPEDFGGEPGAGRKSKSGNKFKGGFILQNGGKRLFRDEEDAVAGGVCSGLAAFFGIADPVWIRLIFVILTLVSGGFWVPAYLLLWILVPPARTAADRLAMRGQPINVDNIAKEVEEGFERLANHFNPETRTKAENAVDGFVRFVGKLFALFVQFMMRFGGVIAIIVGLALVVALAVSWITGVFGIFAAAPYLEYFSPSSTRVAWLGFANLFFLLSIPVLGLCLFFTRILFKWRTPGWLKASLGLFWTMNLLSACIVAFGMAKEYRHSTNVTTPVDLGAIRGDTLRIEAEDFVLSEEHDEDFMFNSESFFVHDDRLIVKDMLEVMIEPSESGRFECNQVIKSRGRSNSDAMANARAIQFNVRTDGRVLRIPSGYQILRGNKWRIQEVKVKIGVPVGKSIVFGKNIYERARSNYYADREDGPHLRDHPDQVFRMTKNGLVCSECPQFGDRDYNGRDYEKFTLEGDFDTEIRKGDRFSIQTDASVADRNLVETIRSGDNITFSTHGKTPKGKIRLIIETPTFTKLHVNNTGQVTIRGFDEDNAEITGKGTGEIKFYSEVNHLTLSLSGKCSIELTGNGEDLKVNLTDGAGIDGANWRTDNAEVWASDKSHCRLNVNNDALVKSDASSIVVIDGTAKVRNN